jgi:hypothetical protein
MLKLAIKIGLAVLVVAAVIFLFFPDYNEEKVNNDDITEEEIEFDNMVAEIEELDAMLDDVNNEEINNIIVE